MAPIDGNSYPGPIERLPSITHSMTAMFDRSPIVVSPWLPTESVPYAGTFVVDAIHYLRTMYGVPPLVVHLDDTFRSSSPEVDRWAASKLVERSVRGRRNGLPRTHHVPLPVSPRSGWSVRVATAASLGRSLRGLGGPRVDVHAHVALVSGPASLQMAETGRLILYEHASFVFDVLEADADVRELYRRVVERSAFLLCVNPRMAERFTSIFPTFGDKIRVHPNPVDFDRFKVDRPRRYLTRWLYIGNLKPSKGTRRLIAAFERALGEFPDITLTVVGRGEEARWLASRDFGGRLRLLPPVPAAAVPQLMADCDVLVHLSEAETFGVTAVEAIATGMPVIVSSTEGSEFVLRPVIGDAGEIVPQPATPESVVSAYSRIREMPPDVRNARQKLRRWLSPEAVAASLAELLSG